MNFDESLHGFYTGILKRELAAAMGCTEPIAIAYAAAKAGSVLGEEPIHISVNCSGNIIKNAKGVTVPNSGGQKGIEAAAILGLIAGDETKGLEVISEAGEKDQKRAALLAAEHFCDVNLVEGVPNLYIEAVVKGQNHETEVIIEENHTNIVYVRYDEEILFSVRTDKEEIRQKAAQVSSGGERRMALKEILDYADTVNLSLVKELLERQIQYNMAIAQEGLDNPWGARVGKTILETWGNDVKACACAKAAAGSDARMSGCSMPVVINSGSGNQGITVTVPVVEYAKEWKLSQEKLHRALIVSNLVSVYIKHYIGALSAFCGAVSAAAGAGAAITYMAGADYFHVGKTITITLATVGGIICDGAKSSCAAKIAASVHTAILAHYMSMEHKEFKGGEGFVEDDVEDTIKNMGYIGKVGMRETDIEILNVMIDKVDVDRCL